MMKFYVCLMLACLLFSPACACAQNPFMSSEGVTTDAQGDPDDAASEMQSKDRFRLTSLTPVRFLTSHLAKMQSAVRRDMENLLAGHGNKALPKTVLLLAFFSFLYGMIHAAGPGHGKVFIGSYMIAGRSRFIDAVKAAMTIVAAHTLSAGILIVAFLIFFKTATMESTTAAEGCLQLISAALICLVGAYLLIRGVLSAFRKETDSNAPPGLRKDKGLFALALSVGLIPCPGVMLIMLFAINLGMVPAGILAVLSMASGMFVTITLIGALSLAAGKSALFAGQSLWPRRRFISNGLTIGGALLVLGFGLLLFVGY
jgi:ABC-type nickel/cobalt efflux system permease component RcnA